MVNQSNPDSLLQDQPATGQQIHIEQGAAESARLNDREKRRVVKNCMRGRGYRVLN